jgi:hypothetical protein
MEKSIRMFAALRAEISVNSASKDLNLTPDFAPNFVWSQLRYSTFTFKTVKCWPSPRSARHNAQIVEKVSDFFLRLYWETIEPVLNRTSLPLRFETKETPSPLIP